MLGTTYRARHAAPRPELSRLRAAAAGTAATLVLGGLALTVQLPAASADVLCTHKCYSAVVTPQSSPASTSVNFTMTLTNLNAQRLGSANITPPAGYTVTSVGTPLRGSAELVGGVIQLRNIDLPPGAPAGFGFTATTPATAGTYAWSVAAKQANDFNGVGNDLVQDPGTSDLTTVVTGPTTTPVCPPGTVSCASTTINYNEVSIVSTCADADATKWLCGTITFPDTGQVGSQVYEMRASALPGVYCPLGNGTVQCTFEMYIDPVPAVYAGFEATLVLVCDVTKCPEDLVSLTKLDEESNQTTPILPCVPGVSTEICFEQERQLDGDLEVIVRNIGPGDPKIAGLTL